MSGHKVASITGTITLADGSTSEFSIGTDFGWQQWGAIRERLGSTVQVMDALVTGLVSEEIPWVSDEDEDEDDAEQEGDPCSA